MRSMENLRERLKEELVKRGYKWKEIKRYAKKYIKELEKGELSKDLNRLREQAENMGGEERAVLEALADILEGNNKVKEDMKENPSRANAGGSNKIIGRVSLSYKNPAKPSSFPFWIEDSLNVHVEPGTIITCESDSENIKVIGIVENIEAMSDIPNITHDFYSYDYGNPNANLSVERPTVREAVARVVHRNDGRAEPLMRQYPVRFATREEIIDAYSGGIPEKNRFLLGFTQDADNKPVPVYGDFNYIFGFNGVHVNISGASGLAAKTSYAIFLIFSLLSISKKYADRGVSVIAFNVKEKDLLDLLEFKEKFKNLEEAVEDLKKHPDPNVCRSAELWEAAKKEGVDPFELKEKDVKILEPGKNFKFGFMDLIDLGDGTPEVLRMLFEKEDINEQFEALLISIVEEFGGKEKAYSFKKLQDELKNKLAEKKGDHVNLGGVPHHKRTISKFLNRLKVSLNHLSKIIDEEKPRAEMEKKIPFGDIKPGKLFIINIEPLPDKGKRLVFLSVLKVLNRILEAKKGEEETVPIWSDDYPTKDFPCRICVFVDELNKFAPAGKAYSPIKAPIVDIAARGRSIGLSLIGAQQMASQVDEEVMANTSTHVVGRSHPIELKERVYEWLRGALKDRVTVLKHGEVIVNHAIHNAPVLLRFPIPLHRIPE